MKQNNLKEEIKDLFLKTGVKQLEDGRVIVYFTPDSATELIEQLTTLIDKVREEDWTTIHRAIIDALFSVNKRYTKDNVGLEGYGYNKGINKAISKLNQLLDLSEQYLQSIKEDI